MNMKTIRKERLRAAALDQQGQEKIKGGIRAEIIAIGWSLWNTAWGRSVRTFPAGVPQLLTLLPKFNFPDDFGSKHKTPRLWKRKHPTFKTYSIKNWRPGKSSTSKVVAIPGLMLRDRDGHSVKLRTAYPESWKCIFLVIPIKKSRIIEYIMVDIPGSPGFFGICTSDSCKIVRGFPKLTNWRSVKTDPEIIPAHFAGISPFFRENGKSYCQNPYKEASQFKKLNFFK